MLGLKLIHIRKRGHRNEAGGITAGHHALYCVHVRTHELYSRYTVIIICVDSLFITCLSDCINEFTLILIYEYISIASTVYVVAARNMHLTVTIPRQVSLNAFCPESQIDQYPTQSPGGSCSICLYPPVTHLKLKSREISFAYTLFLSYPIVLIFCTGHGSITAVLCAKYQNDRQLKWVLLTNEISRDLSLGWVSWGLYYVACDVWSQTLTVYPTQSRSSHEALPTHPQI